MINSPINTITCRDLFALSKQGPIQLIDVRTPEEFQEVHATFARNSPLDALEPHQLAETCRGTDEPIYFICHVGGRSAYACAMLMAAGYPTVVNVEGGTEAWIEAGLPVV